MKVIKVNEVISEIDDIIKKKQEEKEQILLIRDEMNQLINLDDGLEGEGGVAIKEHFMTLHFPALILFHLFLEEYINVLEQIKNLIHSFENENGLVREEFIRDDVNDGLKNMKEITHDIIADINSHYNEVSDLVPSDSVDTTGFDFQISNTKEMVHDTLEKFAELDEDSTSKLEAPADSIDEINQFVVKIQGWTKNGVFLTPSQIEEVESYFMESDVIEDMINSATKLSVEQGDSTAQGTIANWLTDLGKFNGVYTVAKGALAVRILKTGMLEMTKDGKGNFIITASEAWKKGKSGKYESKAAEVIYSVMKKGDKNSANPIKAYLAKYGNAPSGFLRERIGLEGKTNKISFGKLADGYSGVLVFDKNAADNYRMRVDVGATTKQFTTIDGLTNLAKRVPYAGVLFSVGTNSGEFFSDENEHKSGLERIGRFTAGLGLDAGVAGVTTAGAGVGSMIAPGVGTIIGGVVGAGVGIFGSWTVEDTVKEWGETAGRWVEDKTEDLLEWSWDTLDSVEEKSEEIVSSVTDFVSSIFN